MAPEQAKTTKNDNSYFSIVMQMQDVRIPSNMYMYQICIQHWILPNFCATAITFLCILLWWIGLKISCEKSSIEAINEKNEEQKQRELNEIYGTMWYCCADV